LFNFICCDGKDIEDFGHYFHDDIHHFLIQCRFGVDFQPLKEDF